MTNAFFGKILLAFALLHFVLQGQICPLLQVSLDFLLLYSARDQPQLIQGIRRRDGVGEDQETMLN